MSSNHTFQIDLYIKIILITITVYWSFLIFQPFLVIVIWAAIIAIALFPLFKLFVGLLKGKKSLAASLLILILILLIALPSLNVAGSVVDTTKAISNALEEGNLVIPPPDMSIKEWPLIGNEVYNFWYQSSFNLEKTLLDYKEEVSQALTWFFSVAGSMVGQILLSIVSVIIAGVMFVYADSAYNAFKSFFDKLVPGKGEDMTKTSRDTIMSVVKGLVLIAIIQSVLSGIGFAMVGIPGAGIWAIVVLICSVIQLPVLLIMVVMIVYVFSIATTWVAIVFAVFAIFVGILDNILKPILLGRGLKIPMPVILIGAIGGMILHGILGLFIGPVVLAMAWQLYGLWISNSVS